MRTARAGRKSPSTTKANATEIAKILGGKPEGTGYLRPSLGVSDGARGLVFHCAAGCKPRDIIAL
jgi:putative DNA primase/helicase